MDWKNALSASKQILNIQLMSVGTTSVTVGTLLTVIVIALATWWLSRAARRRVVKSLEARNAKPGATGAISALVNYVILLTGLAIALDTFGLDLGALFAGGALFAVAIGFAMQNIAQNFVSGIILMVERTINPGDVLEVDKLFIRIKHIGIRASVGKTRDGEDVIIPNSALVGGNVKNLSMEDSSYRLRASAGVTYGSDMALVRRVLEQTAEDLVWRDQHFPPRVWMSSFGDNAVIFEVGIWITDPFNRSDALSDLHEAIWAALKAADITIAFPQLDVHFDPPVEGAVVNMAKSA